jgi:phosphatidylinositol glycan class O
MIAHYLGVDHAGHTYGVNSRQMEDKLAQMDDQVSTVIGEQLVAHSSPTEPVGSTTRVEVMLA